MPEFSVGRNVYLTFTEGKNLKRQRMYFFKYMYIYIYLYKSTLVLVLNLSDLLEASKTRHSSDSDVYRASNQIQHESTQPQSAVWERKMIG